MVLDATKPHTHKEILTRELESVGIRLNRSPPNIYFKKKKTVRDCSEITPIAPLWVLLIFALVCCTVSWTNRTLCIKGGVHFNATVPLTHMDEKLVGRVLQEYKVHNADILFREDATVDDFIDVMEVESGTFAAVSVHIALQCCCTHCSNIESLECFVIFSANFC